MRVFQVLSFILSDIHDLKNSVSGNVCDGNSEDVGCDGDGVESSSAFADCTIFEMSLISSSSISLLKRILLSFFSF